MTSSARALWTSRRQRQRLARPRQEPAALLAMLSTRCASPPGPSEGSPARRPGKPTPAPRSAQVERLGAPGRELRRCRRHAGPRHLRERRRPDEIHPVVPLRRGGRYGIRPSEVRHERASRPPRSAAGPTSGRVADSVTAGLRRLGRRGGRGRASAVSAPGVTPSMRAAWPRVCGRTAASFSRHSLERPPTAA